MKSLSKSQIYAILYLKDIKKLKQEEISSELKISKERLIDFITNDYATYAVKPEKKTAKDLMINQTVAKKEKTVSIMTQEASMAIDEEKKKNPSPRKAMYDQFKIR